MDIHSKLTLPEAEVELATTTCTVAEIMAVDAMEAEEDIWMMIMMTGAMVEVVTEATMVAVWVMAVDMVEGVSTGRSEGSHGSKRISSFLTQKFHSTPYR
jgi:hypothetical protein